MRIRLAIALGCIPVALAVVGVVLVGQSRLVQRTVLHTEDELMRILRLTDQIRDSVERIQIDLWRKRVTEDPSIDELIRLTESADQALAELSLIHDVQPTIGTINEIRTELEEFKRLTSAAITISDAVEARRRLDELLAVSDRTHELISQLNEYTSRHADEEFGKSHQQTRLFLALVLGALAGLFVLSTGLVVNVVRGIAEPVNRLMSATQRFAERDFAYRADESLLGEFGDLAVSLNRMAGELSRAEELRLEAVRALVVTVDHEVRNALAAIIGVAEVLRKDAALNRDAADGAIAEIIRQVQHIQQVLSELERLQKIDTAEYARGIRMLKLEGNHERSGPQGV